MRAYTNMSTGDFMAQLRDIAINAGGNPLIIDQIDAIVDAPSEEEIDERINQAVEEAERNAYDNGVAEGEQNKENAADDAATEMYKACCAAIEARGVEIGLTDEQVYKVVNHILWDVRP